MKTLNIKHIMNEKARRALSSKRFSDINTIPSNSLMAWINGIRLYNGYFLSPIEKIDSQIQDYKSIYSDKFSIEMVLNKIHLQDDYDGDFPKENYLGIYFNLCYCISDVMMNFDIGNDVIVWYSTDSYEKDEEYPSHTMSFAMARVEGDYYPLQSDKYENSVHIGTMISLL